MRGPQVPFSLMLIWAAGSWAQATVARSSNVGPCGVGQLSELAEPGFGHSVTIRSREPATLYTLKPYNLHLSLGRTGTAQLHVFNSQGDLVTTGVSFYGYDTSLISVSESGLVTALRAEDTTEIGTWVLASVDGTPAQNTSVVRVLSRNYGIDFVERVAARTVLYSPLEIFGEDIDQVVVQYEIPQVNEHSYSIQYLLMSVIPFGGFPQIFEVDFGESEANRVCGISGNPIRLGWNLDGNEWQNCFLVPFIPPRSPQWFVMEHELGHNMSWPSYTFGNSIGPFFSYSEGVASYLALISMRWIFERPGFFPAGAPARISLQQQHDNNSAAFTTSFQDWLDVGAPFETIDPNIVDGLLLNHQGPEPDYFAMRFFNLFRPDFVATLQPLVDQISNDDMRHTFFAATCSVAAEEDLYNTFLNIYHYPLVASYYDAVHTALNNLPAPQVPFVFADNFESGDTSAWSAQQPPP